MADDVKIGSASIDVRATDDKLKQDFEKAKSSSKKAVDDMNAQFSKIKMSVDASVLKMKFSEAEKWRNDLQAKFEKQIKMNADVSTIQKTKAALDAVNSSLSGMRKEVSETSGVWDKMKGVGAMIGAAFAGRELFNFGKDAIVAAADFEELESYFTGGSEALEQFRKSTGGAVSDGDLIKLSNYATDMNMSLDDQKIAFGIAKEASEKYGTSVEEGFSKFVLASEGNKKAMKALGISQSDFKKAVDEILKSSGLRLEQLSLEQQAEVRSEALIKAKGLTLDEINKKAQSNADKIENMGIVWQKFVINMGKFLMSSGILGLLDKISAGLQGWSIIMGGVRPQGGLSKEGSDYFVKENLNLSKEQLEVQKDIFSYYYKENLLKMANKDLSDEEINSLIMQNKTYGDKIKILRDFDNAKKALLASGKSDPLVMSDEARKEATQKLQEQKDKDLQIEKDYYASVGAAASVSLDAVLKNIDIEITERYKKLSESAKKEVDLAKWIAAEKIKATKDYLDTQYKLLKEKTKIDFSPEGLKGFKATMNGQFSGGGKLKSLSPLSTGGKPSILGDNRSDAEELESWIHGSEAASIAVDTFIDGAMTGMSLLRIRVSETATEAERAFADFGNRAIQVIENLIAKWSLFNIISAIIGGPGIGLASILGIKDGGTVMNGAKVPAFASGVGSYMVPNGYPNDSYPVMVQSGEDLRVRTPMQRKMAEINNEALLGELTKINKTLMTGNINAATHNNSIIIPISLNGTEIARVVTAQQNKWIKSNVHTIDW